MTMRTKVVLLLVGLAAAPVHARELKRKKPPGDVGSAATLARPAKPAAAAQPMRARGAPRHDEKEVAATLPAEAATPDATAPR